MTRSTALALLLSAFVITSSCGKGGAAAPSPATSSSTPVTVTHEQAVTAFCQEYQPLLDALEQVNGLGTATERSELSDAVASLAGEVERLHNVGEMFEAAGDAFKAADVENLAQALDVSRQDFEDILNGDLHPPNQESLVPPLQRAIAGIECAGQI
jgi:hypothetical protein